MCMQAFDCILNTCISYRIVLYFVCLRVRAICFNRTITIRRVSNCCCGRADQQIAPTTSTKRANLRRTVLFLHSPTELTLNSDPGFRS